VGSYGGVFLFGTQFRYLELCARERILCIRVDLALIYCIVCYHLPNKEVQFGVRNTWK
jgi:hypothetical protein